MMELATLYRLRVAKVQTRASLTDAIHLRQKRSDIEKADRFM
jgi:hypothetical protein